MKHTLDKEFNSKQMEPRHAVPGVCSGSSFYKWPALGHLAAASAASHRLLGLHGASITLCSTGAEMKAEVSKIDARPDAMARAAKDTCRRVQRLRHGIGRRKMGDRRKPLDSQKKWGRNGDHVPETGRQTCRVSTAAVQQPLKQLAVRGDHRLARRRSKGFEGRGRQ